MKLLKLEGETKFYNLDQLILFDFEEERLVATLTFADGSWVEMADKFESFQDFKFWISMISGEKVPS